ncbi:MAG: cytochrome P460 [Acidobacteria bacterium]|nr:MAG: cytochrome P460 [Acidobacteriota bacterium]
MKRTWICVGLSVLAVALVTVAPQASSNIENSAKLPVYTPDGNLKFPTQYREWVYLTSGVDMSYSPNMSMDHSMFDNVFVNPEAYRAFLQTGTWPDKTMLVLEARMAGSKGSINKTGHFQTGEIMGREVHVKDASRFTGKWAFFNADDGVTGKLLPREMDCYSCHEQHGAVDTTFVQFYPTLLEIAKKRNTLSAEYVKEEAAK